MSMSTREIVRAKAAIEAVVEEAHRRNASQIRIAAARIQSVARAGTAVLSTEGPRWIADLEKTVAAYCAAGVVPSLFEAMGLSHSERHYNRALGWLLSPTAGHGAARPVLEVLAAHLNCAVLAEDVREGEAFDVRREISWPTGAESKRQPDLLVVSPRAILLIEDKVHHVEGRDQYPDYLAALTRLAASRNALETRAFLCAPELREIPEEWTGSITHAQLSSWIIEAAGREGMATWDRVLCLLVAEEIGPTIRLHHLRGAQAMLLRMKTRGVRARDVRQAQEILSRLGEPACPWRMM